MVLLLTQMAEWENQLVCIYVPLQIEFLSALCII